MIYLDNAATTLFKPEAVYIKSDNAFRYFSANAGRGGHYYSLLAQKTITSAREEISEKFNAQCENTVFTFGCTDSLNIAVKGFLSKGDHAIISAYEHNSVIRPLEFLKSIGVSYTVVYPDMEHKITIKEIEKAKLQNTKAVIINHVSNVTGAVQDVESICNFCNQKNLISIIDCAQSAGTQKLPKNATVICCAGHKGLYGPQGIGLLICYDTKRFPRPLRHGGTGTATFNGITDAEMPEYLECGTLPVQNISALAEGVQFAFSHREEILEKEKFLARRLISELNNISEITVYSPVSAKSGVVAFNLSDFPSGQVSDILSKNYGICVRGGFHCAPFIHKYKKTDTQGMIRASFSAFNTTKDVSALIKAINKIKKAGINL